MAIKQLSIFVENKAGVLSEVTELIAKSGVDIRAISVADTEDFGILRLIVDDVEKAKNALCENNSVVSITQVVGVIIEDEPGSMAKVIRILSDNGINIEYMYAFVAGKDKSACVVLRVKDNEKAEEILSGKGIRLVTESDVQEF